MECLPVPKIMPLSLYRPIAPSENIGYFTVFNVETPASPAFTYTGQDPFAEIGYYYNPVQGYFVGGLDNRNDIFIWSTDIATTFTGSGDLNGKTYVFQLPVIATIL